MSHITKEEYLSALLDGEAGSFEQHRLCDQLESDGLMRDKFSSFALIGEAIRHQSQVKQAVAGDAFLKGIQGALEEVVFDAPIVDETPVISTKVAKRRIFPKQTIGYAIAASVAAVAAISMQNYFTEQPSEIVAQASPAVMLAPTSNALMAASLGSKAVAQTVYSDMTNTHAPDAETRGMMKKYIAHHLQYASSATLMPSVRAVSYSTDF